MPTERRRKDLLIIFLLAVKSRARTLARERIAVAVSCDYTRGKFTTGTSYLLPRNSAEPSTPMLFLFSGDRWLLVTRLDPGKRFVIHDSTICKTRMPNIDLVCRFLFILQSGPYQPFGVAMGHADPVKWLLSIDYPYSRNISKKLWRFFIGNENFVN